MGTLLTGIGAFLVIRVCCCLRAYSPDNSYHFVSLASKGLDITNVRSLKFRLRACANAHIVLQEGKLPALNTPGTWIFVIGSYDNTKNEIADTLASATTRYAEHTEALLDCTEFRTFWISWENGLLQSGKGDKIDRNVVSAHQISPVKQFNYAFVFTGWGSYGCWDIDIGSAVLDTNWIKLPGNKKLQGLKVKSYQTRSQMECNLTCVTPTEDLPCGCVEYSYNKLTKQCLVVDEGDEGTVVDAANWKTWKLI